MALTLITFSQPGCARYTQSVGQNDRRFDLTKLGHLAFSGPGRRTPGAIPTGDIP
jgi:hypothetical protein